MSQAIRVYLVDDQRTVRELLKAILQLEFEVEAFATGEEIIAACRENPPDVVLSDLVMPEMGGIEVLKSLKSTVKTKNVPVIVLTAQTDITKLEEALAEGAHDYITKPCEPTELRARIRGAFSLHEAQRELARANQELEATYRVIKREMEAIGTLQRVLLPKGETIEDEFHIVNSYYKPCMDSGGDFFDIVRIDENRCVFAVGDVSGHGAKATVIMAVLKVIFTEYVLEAQDPSQLLKTINEKLIQCLPVQAFITFFVGTMDFSTGVFQFSSAGHEKPFWYHRLTGKLTQLETDMGYPLLMDSDAEFSLHSVQLDSGDRIFLYTDGVYDILNAKKERLGYEKFLHTMEQLLPLPQEQFWMGLSAFLDAFSTRGHRPDDITYLCLESKV